MLSSLIWGYLDVDYLLNCPLSSRPCMTEYAYGPVRAREVLAGKSYGK